MKMRRAGVPTLPAFISDNIKKDETLAFDGRVFSVAEGEELEKAASERGARVRYDTDLVSDIWEDRPPL